MSDPKGRDDLASALGELGERLQGADRARLRARRTRVAAVLSGISAVALVLTVTPPGRALADKVGELVGIGSEPTRPEVRHSFSANSVVIGTGTTPNGRSFEVVVSHAFDGKIGRPGYTDDCVGLSMPEGPRNGFRQCVTPEARSAFLKKPITVLPNLAVHDLAGPGTVQITGTGTDAVAAVEILYETLDGEQQTVEPTIYRLDTELAAGIDAEQPFVYYQAFVEVPGIGQADFATIGKALLSVEAVAYDVSGAEIGRAKAPATAVLALPEETVREALRERGGQSAGDKPRPASDDEVLVVPEP